MLKNNNNSGRWKNCLVRKWGEFDDRLSFQDQNTEMFLICRWPNKNRTGLILLMNYLQIRQIMCKNQNPLSSSGLKKVVVLPEQMSNRFREDTRSLVNLRESNDWSLSYPFSIILALSQTGATPILLYNYAYLEKESESCLPNKWCHLHAHSTMFIS